jgi:hypothetical protein
MADENYRTMFWYIYVHEYIHEYTLVFLFCRFLKDFFKTRVFVRISVKSASRRDCE